MTEIKICGITNIEEALAVAVPHAVVINSGIERAPGIKDHDRLWRIAAIFCRSDPRAPQGIFSTPTKGKGNKLHLDKPDDPY